MSETIEYDLTGNFGLKKPWLDADDDIWGEHVNENMDLIDNLLLTRGFDASKYLPLAGGEMLGMLTLFDDPAEDMDAATKRYVDAHVPAGGPFLPLDGGEMLGTLTLFDDPAGDMDAATKRYVDAVGGAVLGELAGYLPLTGGTVQGAFNVVVPGIGVTPVMFTNGAGAPPAIPAGALDAGTLAVAMSSSAGQQAEMQVIGIGSAPAFIGAFAGGTLAAPTPVNVNNAMVQMFGRGYDGAGWFNAANVAIRGAELWTPTAHGTQIRFSGTPTGSTALAEWARFANGDLLIGSTVDAGYKLDVAGGPVRLGGATNATAPHIMAAATSVIPASGFPSATMLEIVGPPALNCGINLDGFSNGLAGGGGFITGRNRNSAGPTAATQALVLMRGMGWDGTNYSSSSRVGITLAAAESFSPTAQGTYITFSTTPKTTVAFAEAMRIQDSGNVSIGTTTDDGTNKLQVAGFARIDSGSGGAFPAGMAGNLIVSAADASQPVIAVGGFGAGVQGTVNFYRASGTRAAPTAASGVLGQITAFGYGTTGFSAAGRAAIQFATQTAWTDAAQPTYLAFRTTPLASIVTAEAMRIQPSGNLSIGGTADNGYKLDVTGSARAGSFATTALLTNAADDAAAASAGVALNQFYRNGSVVMQRAA